ISANSAILSGYVSSNGSATNYWFQWGTNPSLFSNTTNPLNLGYNSSAVSDTIYGLQPNTTYYFRAVAQNSYGTNYGQILSLTTSGTVIPPPVISTLPTTLTSIATSIGQTSASLNGIVFSNGSATNVSFEWGSTTALGQTTGSQSLGIVSAYAFANTISNLQPSTTYYFRAVGTNQYGTTRGDIVSFTTRGVGSPNIIPTTVVGSSSLVALKIETKYATISSGDISDYTVTYKNTSYSKTLTNAVLQVKIPKEMEFNKATTGSYSKSDQTLTVELGNLAPREGGTISLQVKILSAAKDKDMLVMSGVLAYTNPSNDAQENALAYSITKVVKDGSSGNLLGAASIFGDGSFLPTTLLGWLALTLIIFGLIIFGRKFYGAKQTQTQMPK
ncbi:MAG: hypothetical protein WC795_02735, partial [Candidatus Paceibacterota bacterium]